jgi:hypothetical protein
MALAMGHILPPLGGFDGRAILLRFANYRADPCCLVVQASSLPRIQGYAQDAYTPRRCVILCKPQEVDARPPAALEPPYDALSVTSSRSGSK